MTITKQDTIDYSNTTEQDIYVNAEAIDNSNGVPVLVVPTQDNVPTAPTMTTDLVVTTNTSDDDDNESITANDTIETETPEAAAVAEQASYHLERMKRRRVRSQTAAGWIGAATGLVLLGVPGAIIVGIASNKITKHSLKRLESKAKDEYELRLAQEQFTPANHNDETLITRAVVA